MPFEARKTNFTIFSVSHELYNLIKSALKKKLEFIYKNERTDVKTRGGELIKLSILKPEAS